MFKLEISAFPEHVHIKLFFYEDGIDNTINDKDQQATIFITEKPFHHLKGLIFKIGLK